MAWRGGTVLGDDIVGGAAIVGTEKLWVRRRCVKVTALVDLPSVEDGHQVVFGRDEEELSAVAIAREDPGFAVFDHRDPLLVAIGGVELVVVGCDVSHDGRRGGLDPLPRYDLPTVPFATPQEEVADPGQGSPGQGSPPGAPSVDAPSREASPVCDSPHAVSAGREIVARKSRAGASGRGPNATAR